MSATTRSNCVLQKSKGLGPHELALDLAPYTLIEDDNPFFPSNQQPCHQQSSNACDNGWIVVRVTAKNLMICGVAVQKCQF